MTYAMRLNGGELIRDGEGVKHDGFTVNVNIRGTRFGNGEPLFQTINTLMTQGSWERITRFGNRAPALEVEISGETPEGLNAGGVWLSSLMRPGTLEYLPRDQNVWTVFDVVSCYIDIAEDDDWDLDEARWIRTYRIPIKAFPSSRSRFRTITPALPLASTPIIDELVTDASSATGWTAGWKANFPRTEKGTLTPTVVSGRVRVTDTVSVGLPGDGSVTLALTYQTGEIATETPFLRVDFRISEEVALERALATQSDMVDLVVAPVQVATTDAGGGITAGTAYYRIAADTRSLTMRARNIDADGDNKPDRDGWLEVDQIRRVSRLPDTGTNRQKVAVIEPGGSAPAVGSLHVSHPTAGLGRVLIATYPLGRPSPALMQYRFASDEPVPDTSQINGQRIPLAGGIGLHVPDPQLPIRGRAAVWAKMRVDTAAVTVRCVVGSRMNTTGVGPQQTHEVTVGAATTVLVPIGLYSLPTGATGAAGHTLFNFSKIGGSGVAFIDQVWAFGQDEESALTIVDAGSGTPEWGGPANHLWINEPTVEKPAGEVLIGTSPAEARWPSSIQAGPEVHRFGRDGVACLTVTCGATDAATDFSHFKRWDHFAAEES